MNGNKLKNSLCIQMTCRVGWMVLLMLISTNVSLAQYLQAGDRFPDIKVTNVDHWEGGEIDFSVLRGKLVVLDFWTVYCAACIQDMPKMERLQEEFGSSVQIILVTSSSRDQVENLKKRSENLRNVRLPMIMGDTILNNLFSFRLVPTHVWINEGGIVTQVTGPYTTRETLTAHLSGDSVELVQSYEHKDFNSFAPLLKEGEGRQLPYVQQYAVIFSKLNDDASFTGVFLEPNTRKIIGEKMVNKPIIELYNHAYATESMPPDIRSSRVILEVADPDRFIKPKGLTNEAALWRQKNVFCYESYLPHAKPGDLKKTMQLSLNQFFGLKISVERRDTYCYVLYCRDENKLKNTNHSDAQGSGRMKTFKQFFNEIRLEICELGKPLISDIEFEGKILAKTPIFNGDLAEFNGALAQYGLEVRLEIKRLDMLIIQD